MKLVNPSNPILLLNRRHLYSSSSLLLLPKLKLHPHRLSVVIPKPQCPTRRIITSSLSPTVSTPLTFLLSLSLPENTFPTPINRPHLPIKSDNSGGVFTWHRAADTDSQGRLPNALRSRKPVAAVVLLGWLGAEPKHLRRYAELYNSLGIHAVTFVVPVSQVLWFDLGTRVERRIAQLAAELASWLAGPPDDDDRCLIFHTFSNTGWLVYGSILYLWKDRPELIRKIKGCIVDSGGDPELNPKVWAAGFSAAIFRKRSSLTKPSIQGVVANESNSEGDIEKVQGKESYILESMVVSMLENLFSFLFNLPDVNKRLITIITVLSEKPPSYPYLYLYSTADKVIPCSSVESFIKIQRAKGLDVGSFNFQSSPHVDHFRTFSDLYTSLLHNFLKKCFASPNEVILHTSTVPP
uniref:Transmembrane protein 53 n=1 Tax=Kalanchoe fedtschenkoi TaxID=63787 RepID=A0A7N0TDZ3_KALFE